MYIGAVSTGQASRARTIGGCGQAPYAGGLTMAACPHAERCAPGWEASRCATQRVALERQPIEGSPPNESLHSRGVTSPLPYNAPGGVFWSMH